MPLPRLTVNLDWIVLMLIVGFVFMLVKWLVKQTRVKGKQIYTISRRNDLMLTIYYVTCLTRALARRIK